MTTRTLFVVVALLGVVVALGAFGFHMRRKKAAEAERMQGIALEREREELDRRLDAGRTARFYGGADAGRAPCHCEPGDPLCSCL